MVPATCSITSIIVDKGEVLNTSGAATMSVGETVTPRRAAVSAARCDRSSPNGSTPATLLCGERELPGVAADIEHALSLQKAVAARALRVVHNSRDPSKGVSLHSAPRFEVPLVVIRRRIVQRAQLFGARSRDCRASSAPRTGREGDGAGPAGPTNVAAARHARGAEAPLDYGCARGHTSNMRTPQIVRASPASISFRRATLADPAAVS